MKITKLLISAIAVFTFAAANMAHAQTATATGTVVEPLTVATTTNLNFGNSLFRGSSVTVAPTNGAQFTVSGQGGQEVSATVTVPSGGLTHTDGTITETLPVTFGTGNLVHNTETGTQATADFTSGSATITRVLEGTQGETGLNNLYLWIGGTVTPGASQPAGTYTGTIEATVSYVNK